MKSHLRICMAWMLLLLSSFSAFSASAFSGVDANGDLSSVISRDRFYNSHTPGFHTAPSDVLFSNILLEVFDVEEETESEEDDREAAAEGESDNDDQNDPFDAELTSANSFAAWSAIGSQNEIFPEGFSPAFPTTRSLYLIFRVFRI